MDTLVKCKTSKFEESAGKKLRMFLNNSCIEIAKFQANLDFLKKDLKIF